MMHRGMSMRCNRAGLTGGIGETEEDRPKMVGCRPKLVVPGSVLSVCQARWSLAC
jgi:hypothetical protein